MTLKDRKKYKTDFKSELDRFAVQLKNYVSTSDGDWTVKGFIDIYKNVYTISSDTKIVSKILEIHIFPLIIEFANRVGYNIVLAEKQNWYPDMTFINKKNPNIKFALDIKTTYRKNNSTTGFTLGSHGSYFKQRDKDKNIQFPYNEYTGHYCLGIIYSRVEFKNKFHEADITSVKELAPKKSIKEISERRIVKVDKLKSIISVIRDFDFFAAEKWKIASDKQGSGNTANIGSIFDIEDLKNENGTFSNLSEHWFDEYWINFGSVTFIKGGKQIKITSLKDFLEFKGRSDLWTKVVKKTSSKKS